MNVSQDYKDKLEKSRCGNCFYSSSRTSAKESRVFCRRSPPRVDADAEVTDGYWPSVERHDWCGEWRENEVVP